MRQRGNYIPGACATCITKNINKQATKQGNLIEVNKPLPTINTLVCATHSEITGGLCRTAIPAARGFGSGGLSLRVTSRANRTPLILYNESI